MGKSYLERSLAWGARDDARRAKERARRERQERQREERRTAKQQGRSFGQDNGTVDGVPAYVQLGDERMVAYWGQDHEGKIVTNDGLNAEYLRDDDGYVSLDYRGEDSYVDPYQGYNRYDF